MTTIHKIPQMEPWFGFEEQKALHDYMGQGGWVTEFKKTKEFELELANYIGVKHCIAVNNGTISLTLAAMGCEIQSGDEVIIPNYTMIATPNSVKMFGANPVFVDVEVGTLNLDIELVEKAITPQTKAVILVNANGRGPLPSVDAFKNLCDKYSLVLIEDSAQALGSFYSDGRHMGTVGKVGSFSFSAPKIISTGQGGALVTNCDDMAAKLRKLKDFGRSSGGNDIHDSIGFNFKFTDIQAVIGIEQMKKLEWRIGRKKEILKKYQEKLRDVAEVRFFEQDLSRTAPWFIDVLVENRCSLMNYLKENGIGTRLMYSPINEQKAYDIPGEYPVSKLVGQKGLWLPSSSQLTNDEIDYICNSIISFY